MKNKALLQTNLKARVLQGFIILAIILLILSLASCEYNPSELKPSNNKDTTSVESLPLTPGGTMPVLQATAQGILLDNGCLDRSNPIQWSFEWKPVENAEAYHLHVIGSKAAYPVIDNSCIIESIYQYACEGCYITDYNSKNWTWKVRVKLNGEWGPWASSTFDVEDVDTDCKEEQ